MSEHLLQTAPCAVFIFDTDHTFCKKTDIERKCFRQNQNSELLDTERSPHEATFDVGRILFFAHLRARLPGKSGAVPR